MLKAVIWDMDGVIANTAPLHYEAWRKIAKKKGLNLTEEEFRATFGMKNPDILEKLFGKLEEAEVEKLSFEKEEEFRALARKGIGVFPGVVPLLRELHESGIKQAIASSTPIENIKIIVTTLKINEYFEVIVTGEDVKHGKPHPEVFLKAKEKLEVAPSECLVIEDAEVGVEAAKRAGMKCLAVTNTLPREKLKKADLVVSSLEEVNLSILRQLFD